MYLMYVTFRQRNGEQAIGFYMRVGYETGLMRKPRTP